MQKKQLGMAKHLSPIFKGVRGSVNRQFVFKQVAGETIVTNFPDRTKVIYSQKQKQVRRKFSDAVFFARLIIGNPELKKFYSLKASLLKFRSAWNVAIAEHMSDEPLTVKPEKIPFDKGIIQDQMGRDISVKLYSIVPALPLITVIQTGEAMARRKPLRSDALSRSLRPCYSSSSYFSTLPDKVRRP